MKIANQKRISFVLLCILFISVLLTPLPAYAKGSLPVMQGEIRTRLGQIFQWGNDQKAEETTLHVGGCTFGVRLFCEGVQIVGISDTTCPAALAGLEKKDRIIQLDGVEVRTVEDVVKAIEGCDGRSISVLYRGGTEDRTTAPTPVQDATGKYRAGLWVRDTAAGIGTLTFVQPESGVFGGLGHGICDGESGELLPLSRGAVVEAEINSVVPGKEGTPGELKGSLSNRKIGTLLLNCDRGIFGVLSPIPSVLGEPLPVGYRREVHAGDALLRCSLSDGQIREYKVELADVHHENKGTKCFSVHVTDPELLCQTGGIVQGMSGSPILQDGKLVGAVTHVLIGDPTRGYGIFLENMLAALPRELT